MASEGLIVFAATTPLLFGSSIAVVAFLLAVVRVGWESGYVYSLRPAVADEDRGRLKIAAVVLIGTMGVAGCILPVWMSMSGISVVFLVLVFRVLATELDTTGVGRDGVRSLIDLAVFPGLPVAAFAGVASQENWLGILLIAFILVETFDSFALLGGRLYGRRPLFPRTSAKKTIEGFVTGILALVIVTLVLNWFLALFTLLQCIGIAIAVAGAAVTGDFLASHAKRAAGVKDYPAVLAVQGGLLDIIDAWLVTGPVILTLFWLYGIV